MFKANIIALFLTTVSLSSAFGDINNVETYQKSLIFLLLILILFTRKVKTTHHYTIFTIVFLLNISIFSTQTIDLIAIKRFFGLIIPWVILLQKWKKKEAEQVLDIIPKLAILSIMFGLIASIFDIYQVTKNDFTGATRLQGFLIPPHLAFLAFFGVVTSAYNIITLRKQGQHYLLYVNMLIVILTLTRMAFLASFIIFIYIYVLYFKNLFKKNRHFLTNITLQILSFSTIAALLPYLVYRTFFDTGAYDAYDQGINTSGRYKVWSIYIELASKKLWFGYGLGHGQTVHLDHDVNNLSTPHNEYINFTYDTGLIGLIIFFSMYIFFNQHLKKSISDKKIRSFISLITLITLIYAITDNVFNTIQYSLPLLFFIKAILTKHKDT